MLLESTAVEAALADLPQKIRVHALAKRLGMTSKDVIAALAAQNVAVTSPQSSVTAEVATQFITSLASDAPASTSDTAAPSGEQPAPRARAAAPKARKTAAERSTVERPAAERAVSTTFMNLFTAVQHAEPMKAPLPQGSFITGLVADPFAVNAMLQDAAPIVVTARDMGKEDDSDDNAAEATTGGSGAKGNRGGRGGATRTSGAARSTQASGTSDGDTSDDDAAEPEENDSFHDGEKNGQSSRRRRRRGRRGRGRGRGDDTENTEQTNDSDGEHDGGDDTDANRPSGAKKQPKKQSARPSGTRGKLDSDDTDKAGSDTRGSSTRGSAARGAAAHDGDADVAADARVTADHDTDTEDMEDDNASTHRRRCRRRRSDSTISDSDQDTPPNTVIHERGTTRRRTPASDTVQGISGSTRLEAKRQRRREGRDNARNRIPVLSEAEFLARRESVERTMVVREKNRTDHPGVTTQVGVLEDNILVEHFVTSDMQASMVGNIYLGRVQNVLPSMEAAFIDIGRGRNAVLYAGEVNWAAAGLGGKSRKIEQALSTGDMVLVQVAKDPIAHKGARLTTQISMAGRYLVYVPDGSSAGISRKLPEAERKRLKGILKNIVPGDAGVIIRTAAEGASEEDLKRDIDMLHKQWMSVQQAAEEAQQKADGQARTLHEEPTMLVKVVRDLFNDDFKKLVVEGERAWDTITEYVHKVAPQLEERLERWENGGVDVFQAYRVDEQLAKALDRKVWLPSGGTLVIDRTEAMTVIDVNTGKFTGSGGNLEETVTRNNLEAAEEIVRQLRLRDIGGIVIIDFIDMVLESNRDLVLRRLREALSRDRTRHQVSEVTSLGLVQLTRKRLGTGLLEAFSTPCPHCSGTGYILQSDPVEAITSGTNAEDMRGGRRRRGRHSDKQDKHEDAKAKETNEAKEHHGPDPSEHPMVKAMSRKRDDEADSTTVEAEPPVDTPVVDTKGATETDAAPADTAKTRPHADGTPADAPVHDTPVDGTANDIAAATPDQPQRSTRKRRGARRATQAAGTPTTPTTTEAPAARKEVVAGVLAATPPVAVKADETDKAPRRARRRATRAS